MANIAALLKRIESGTLSYEEKLSALSQVEQSLQDMRQKKQEAIQSNVMLIVDALKQMQVKVEQQLEEAKAIVPQKGQKGDKGDKGDRGLDGAPGKDGRNGIDGKDGKDGNDGISVTDAKIDFDGSLVITLSNGREINVGEVLPLEVSDKIKVIANGGGTSQTVVDTLTSLQNQINTLTGVDGVLGDMAQQNANNVAITGGAINGATIGATTPAAGTFTTLTATDSASLGGVVDAESLKVDATSGSAGSNNYISVSGSTGSGTPIIGAWGTGTNVGMTFRTRGASNYNFATASTAANVQFRIANTASAVNYVQVTGAATTGTPIISAQGSDTNAGIRFYSKGAAGFSFWTNGGSSRQFVVEHTGGTVVNYLQVTGNSTTNSPILSAQGSDTNIDLTLTTKGTGAVNAITGGGTQFKVSNTASAVNYVQVTGAATTIRPAITAQGSDTNIGLSVYTKGTGQVVFGNGGQYAQFRVNGAVNAVNYLQVDGSLTGAAPVLSALGSDTNIDLTLTPKGTGVVQFGTYTATVTAVAGYIQIKDAGGTLRKLAVLT